MGLFSGPARKNLVASVTALCKKQDVHPTNAKIAIQFANTVDKPETETAISIFKRMSLDPYPDTHNIKAHDSLYNGGKYAN